MNKRDFLKILGGGMVLAATPGCAFIQPEPSGAIAPWSQAGVDYSDPRKRALSYAILCPNPHNRQPWTVDLSVDNEVALYIDPERQLPHTDPHARQITIGLGCFLELMSMAAAADGWAVKISAFPEGHDNLNLLDNRSVAIARFTRDESLKANPLFSYVMSRHSLKEPYDTRREVSMNILETSIKASVHGSVVNGTNEKNKVDALRKLTEEALMREIETPRTYKESVDLFRIGKNEIEANPDGIDFSGRAFELMALTGLFTRKKALDQTSKGFEAGKDAVIENTKTAMAHIWLVTPTNTRIDQLNTGRDWMRIDLATTQAGVNMQPLSQALQEYPEMVEFYRQAHEMLAPDGGTVQMLARLGYGKKLGPSPRWSLDAILKRQISS